MEKYSATDMAAQATPAKSLPNPASGEIILAESTQNVIKPNRMATMKVIAKVTLKKIMIFAKFFITLKKRLTREIPYCKMLEGIIFQQVIHNIGMEIFWGVLTLILDKKAIPKSVKCKSL